MSMLLASRSAILCRGLARSKIGGQVVRRTFQEDAAKFFEKHAARKSPLSPSLAILMKSMPLTSFLSITHRVTGMGVGILLYGIGITSMTCSKLSFEQILAKFQSICPDFIFQLLKVATATAIAYHSINGVRHLSWDAGYGFKMTTLYKTGYLVLALTVLSFAYIAIKNNN